MRVVTKNQYEKLMDKIRMYRGWNQKVENNSKAVKKLQDEVRLLKNEIKSLNMRLKKTNDRIKKALES